MSISIQTIYLLTSFITVTATIPQIKQLVLAKQSDQFNLVTWLTLGGNQLMSFIYAISISATAYVIVNVAWISFYIIMLFLIIKYRKRRSLFSTVVYWFQRGREPKHRTLSLQADKLLAMSTTAKEL